MKTCDEKSEEVRAKIAVDGLTGALSWAPAGTRDFDVWLTDAGRSKSGLKETNDCTVRATATALKLTYIEAHAKLAALGRKRRGGLRYKDIVEKLGLETCAEYSGSLKTVLQNLSPGRYVIRKAHHVFAVVDGIVVDSHAPNPRCRVKAVYRVKNN